MASLIELKNVSYAYPLDGDDVPVLKNIDLTINTGEMVAIQGPSGSGKSTFLYILGCLLKPQQGEVWLAGQNTVHLSRDELAVLRNRLIGSVFQQFHLLPRTSVLKNVMLPAQYPVELVSSDSDKQDVAKQLITELGLGSRIDHHPNQLSGGQQQRVAIGRALLNDAPLILADEPTGNLDTKASEQIIELLRKLNRRGKTVVIITHDPEIARKCDRIIHIRDGEVQLQNASAPPGDASLAVPPLVQFPRLGSPLASLAMALRLMPLAFENLKRNKLRSLLTMLGIIIGVAAVLAMVTMGQFTKQKILQSYADLGVNTLEFRGSFNWRLKATDIVPVSFRWFDWERDIVPLRRIFPQVKMMTPVMNTWVDSASFGGRVIDVDLRVYGVNEQWLGITERGLAEGRNFTPYQIETRSDVCLIGTDIAKKLFPQGQTVDQILTVNAGEQSFNCRVIGVLTSKNSNNEWAKPNSQILLPFTYFMTVTDQTRWNTRLRDVIMRVEQGVDVEATGQSIRAFFEMKYGRSGRFRVDSDSVLIAQMNRFLSLFTMLLGTIAMISLAVGGIGITNMMLVSVSERLKEIGLRKAVGATDRSIRLQFLSESILLCGAAGVMGLMGGFAAYEGAIFMVAKLVPKVEFQWLVDWWAVLVSLLAILTVGVLSGLAPALKAERLQVIEALRTD